VNFPGHSLHIRLILNLVFLENLNGHLLASEDVRAETDLAKCALTQRSVTMSAWFTCQRRSGQLSCLLCSAASFAAPRCRDLGQLRTRARLAAADANGLPAWGQEEKFIIRLLSFILITIMLFF
jgi:hypothetical protein